MTRATEESLALGGLIFLATPGMFMLPLALRSLLQRQEYLTGTVLLLPFVCGLALYFVADYNKGKRIRHNKSRTCRLCPRRI